MTPRNAGNASGYGRYVQASPVLLQPPTRACYLSTEEGSAVKVSSADTPSESERTAGPRRWLARPRRWLAGAACGALLAAPVAATSLPAPATASASAPHTTLATTPADQFLGVSCRTSR